MTAPFRLLACNIFLREIQAAILQGGTEFRVTTFPAACWQSNGNQQMINRTVDAVAHGEAADCVLGCPNRFQTEETIHSHQGQQDARLGTCFEMLVNAEIVRHYMQQGAYLLTPGWLENWKGNVAQWGFEAQALKEFFNESVTRLVLLDTGVLADVETLLAEFSTAAGLPYEILPVGLEHLKLLLSQKQLAWQLQQQSNDDELETIHLKQQLADHAMIFDLMAKLAEMTREEDALQKVMELFQMLFACGRLVYYPLLDHEPGKIYNFSSSEIVPETVLSRLAWGQTTQAWCEIDDGFLLQFRHGEETLGILEVGEIAFPEYRARYINIAAAISDVCALAISNARIYQKLYEVSEVLRSERDRVQMYMDIAKVIFVVVGVDGKVLLVNRTGCEILGYPQEEIVGKNWFECFIPENERITVQEKFDQMMSGNVPSTLPYEYHILNKAGQERTVVWLTSPITDHQGAITALLNSGDDVTDRRKTEAALMYSQKLAELGTLAAGVAHEINTPLQVITGTSDSLIRRIHSDGFDSEYFNHKLEILSRSSWRVAEIVRALLAYARFSPVELDEYSLDAIIQDALLLIENHLKPDSNIHLRILGGDHVPPLYCDRNNISQVLVNLLLNALDSMQAGGEIVIRTDYDPKQNKIILQIADQGSGISPEVKDRIFDPFFTTKPLGRGTGLGLSVVLGIVRAHGGEIVVDSLPGRGSTFILSFPVDPARVAQKMDGKTAGRFEDA
jgi:PAS domain S-box-containing protein